MNLRMLGLGGLAGSPLALMSFATADHLGLAHYFLIAWLVACALMVIFGGPKARTPR